MPFNSGLPLTTKLGCLDELSEQGLAVLDRRPSVAEIQVMAHRQGFLVSRAQATALVRRWRPASGRLTPSAPATPPTATEAISSPSPSPGSSAAGLSIEPKWEPGLDRPATHEARELAKAQLQAQDRLGKDRLSLLSLLLIFVVTAGSIGGFVSFVIGFGSPEKSWKMVTLGLILWGLTWGMANGITRWMDRWSARRRRLQGHWKAMASTLLNHERALRWRHHPEAYAYAKACLNTETALMEGDVAVIEMRWGSAIDELQAQNRTRAQLALLEHPFPPPAAEAPKKVG